MSLLAQLTMALWRKRRRRRRLKVKRNRLVNKSFILHEKSFFVPKGILLCAVCYLVVHFVSIWNIVFVFVFVFPSSSSLPIESLLEKRESSVSPCSRSHSYLFSLSFYHFSSSLFFLLLQQLCSPATIIKEIQIFGLILYSSLLGDLFLGAYQVCCKCVY